MTRSKCLHILGYFNHALADLNTAKTLSNENEKSSKYLKEIEFEMEKVKISIQSKRKSEEK